MPVHISFDLSRELYKQALRLQRRKILSALFVYIANRYLFPAIAVFFLILGLWARQRGDSDKIASSLDMFIVSLVCSAIMRLSVWIQTKRNYEATFPENSVSRRMDLILDDTGLTATLSGLMSTRYAWGSISRYVEDEEQILLCLNKKRFILIFLAKASPNEVEQAKRIVRENVRAK